jgi:hypothetical protein
MAIRLVVLRSEVDTSTAHHTPHRTGFFKILSIKIVRVGTFRGCF